MSNVVIAAATVGEARAALRQRLGRGLHVGTGVGTGVDTGAGTDAGDDEGDYLLCHVLGCGRADLYAHPETTLAPRRRRRLESLLTKRLDGVPLAYLTGVREFFSLEFEVSPEVMIPRPETETLVETALTLTPEHARVLDLGTGCGAVAVAVAVARADATVTACDNHRDALAVAERNAARHGVSVSFVASDWFEKLPAGRFDVVVSNPPYVGAGDPELDPAVAAHEPAAAMFAEEGGLACLRRIIADAPGRLAAGGVLALEHGHTQADAVAELMKAARFDRVRCVHDAAGRPRVTLGGVPG